MRRSLSCERPMADRDAACRGYRRDRHLLGLRFVAATSLFLASSQAFAGLLTPLRRQLPRLQQGAALQETELQEATPETAAPEVVNTIWATSQDADREALIEERRRMKQKRRRERRRDKDENRDLIVSKYSNRVRSLADAIADKVASRGSVVLRAVGPQSVWQALKAIAVADERLNLTTADEGLAAVPAFRMIRFAEEDDVANVLTLTCNVLPRPRNREEIDEDRQLLAAGTNERLGKMAAAVKNRIRDDGLAVVLGPNADRLNRGIKAIILASRFLREDEGYDGEELKEPMIAVMPSFREFAPDKRYASRRNATAATTGVRLDCVSL